MDRRELLRRWGHGLGRIMLLLLPSRNIVYGLGLGWSWPSRSVGVGDVSGGRSLTGGQHDGLHGGIGVWLRRAVRVWLRGAVSHRHATGVDDDGGDGAVADGCLVAAKDE